MQHAEPFTTLYELIKDIRVAMLVTRATAETAGIEAAGSPGGGLNARPMWTQDRRQDDDLWYFASRSSGKVQEIEADPRVVVTYSDASKGRYVTIKGKASVESDRAVVRELWNVHARAWFEGGPEDPDVVLIRIKAETAEYWDGPSKAVYLLSLLKSMTVGGQPATGDHEKMVLGAASVGFVG